MRKSDAKCCERDVRGDASGKPLAFWCRNEQSFQAALYGERVERASCISQLKSLIRGYIYAPYPVSVNVKDFIYHNHACQNLSLYGFFKNIMFTSSSVSSPLQTVFSISVFWDSNFNSFWHPGDCLKSVHFLSLLFELQLVDFGEWGSVVAQLRTGPE